MNFIKALKSAYLHLKRKPGSQTYGLMAQLVLYGDGTPEFPGIPASDYEALILQLLTHVALSAAHDVNDQQRKPSFERSPSHGYTPPASNGRVKQPQRIGTISPIAPSQTLVKRNDLRLEAFLKSWCYQAACEFTQCDVAALKMERDKRMALSVSYKESSDWWEGAINELRTHRKRTIGDLDKATQQKLAASEKKVRALRRVA